MLKTPLMLEHQIFFEQIIKELGVPCDHPVVVYLRKKTAAVDKGSKARRSLGNLYALMVLAEDYIAGHDEGTQFTSLLDRMRKKPFGAKLQNHPLDNRLNDEFRRQLNLDGILLPVQVGLTDKGKTRKISKPLLEFNNSEPKEIAIFIVRVVGDYIKAVTSVQKQFVTDLQSFFDDGDILQFIEKTFKPDADARLFEVVSFCILKFHYRKILVTWSVDQGENKQQPLTLYKTGRTNANDGGIDFVLKPLGRFFQVTESLHFKKYFLDFEKLNRVPITFVIKTEKASNEVLEFIYSKSSVEISPEKHAMYMSLFEEIITNRDLRCELKKIIADGKLRSEFIAELIKNYKIEYGYFD